jgi:hypothetical protein
MVLPDAREERQTRMQSGPRRQRLASLIRDQEEALAWKHLRVVPGLDVIVTS